SRSRRHVDGDVGAPARAGVEAHMSVAGGEQRVILADADIAARVVLGAALTHENVPGENELAAELLHAQPLAWRIAPVARAAACFLVCHLPTPCLRRRG